MFVKGRSEISVKKVAIIECFTCDSTYKFKIVQMEMVDIALFRGVESVSSAPRLK